MNWPNNSPFAVWLTHDVDRVKKAWFHVLYYFLQQRRGYHLISKLRKKEPYWNFDVVMNIEGKHKVKSTFFFLNESLRCSFLKPQEWKLAFGRYDINDEKIKEVIRKLNREGWEIGLHGSYYSYINKDLLFQEKKGLENILMKKINGVRQHYLNISIPMTWKLQHEVGFRYDASFGYTRTIGFREEKYHPFFPLGNEFMVIPLAIMDTALFEESRDPDKAWAKCLEIIELAEEKGALLSILWHNRVFDEKEFPGYALTYEKIIIECKNRNAWFGTGEGFLNQFAGTPHR